MDVQQGALVLESLEGFGFRVQGCLGFRSGQNAWLADPETSVATSCELFKLSQQQNLRKVLTM